MQAITSFQNSKIKLANKLVSKRQREKAGLFLIDYARDLDRALECGYDIEFALYCETLASKDDQQLLERLSLTGAEIFAVSDGLMAKASYRQNPGGLVAVMRQKPARALDDAHSEDGSTILAMVDLRKPGNIGALLRTADAAGVDMVFLVDTTLDIYNPNVIRASTGAVFMDNIYMIERAEAFAYFSRHDIRIVAAHLEGEKYHFDVNYRDSRTAIVLGTEDTGLDQEWVARCDELVKIPMMGSLSDSLNVSVSGAIFMYEALRQRLADQAQQA